MKVRCVNLAFVSAAFLAAFAINGSSALAASSSAQSKLTRSAYQALQAGDATGAITQYSEAIAAKGMEPEVLANALLNRALAYQQKSLHDKAIADYTKALNLDAMAPSLRATALYNRGLSQQKIGDMPKAVEDFTGALLLNPEFAHAYYSRGNALRESGQLLFALSDYERAQQFKHPEPAKILFGEAVTYIALRRPQDARKALNGVLELQPEHAGAIGQLAKLNSTAENVNVAEADDILTGSVAALSGGTVAKKLTLPKAVDVPGEITPTVADATVTKKYTDRLPTMETASYSSSSEPVVLENDAQTAVKVDEVPAIPEPAQAEAIEAPVVKKPVKAAKIKPVAEVEQIASAETEEVASPAVASGWMVQLASAASEDAAWSTWKKMQNRNKALKSLSPVVVRADLGTKGVFYRVRLNGFDDQADAKSACGKLKSKGVACYVSKT